MAEGVELSQFSLRRTQLFEEILVEKRHGKFSALQLQFLFDRRSGYFLINFYGPCTLIVILSWVALWLNREATGDRITLGSTGNFQASNFFKFFQILFSQNFDINFRNLRNFQNFLKFSQKL